jgi:putative transposase
MKGKRYTEEQIISALKQAEVGVKVSEICRTMGISEQTFYAWKKKYRGMGVSEVRSTRGVFGVLGGSEHPAMD